MSTRARVGLRLKIAGYYGFTADELDVILNDDIPDRLGGGTETDED